MAEAQKIVNRGIRYLTGVRLSDIILNREISYRELAIPPIHVSASALRARLLRKAATLRTWIRWLVVNPMTGTRKRTWLSGGRQWLRTNAPFYLETVDDATDDRRMSDLRELPEGYRYTNEEDFCKARIWDRYDQRRRHLINVDLYTRRYHLGYFRREWQKVPCRSLSSGES